MRAPQPQTRPTTPSLLTFGSSDIVRNGATLTEPCKLNFMTSISPAADTSPQATTTLTILFVITRVSRLQGPDFYTIRLLGVQLPQWWSPASSLGFIVSSPPPQRSLAYLTRLVLR